MQGGYLSNKQASKMPYRNIRPPLSHSQQERHRSQAPFDYPVEFKDQDLTLSDSPKLIFSVGGNEPYVNSGPITPQHEENIKFMSEEWQHVMTNYENNKTNQSRHGCVLYIEKDGFSMKDFKPFDLEEFWGQRMLNCMLGNDAKQ